MTQDCDSDISIHKIVMRVCVIHFTNEPLWTDPDQNSKISVHNLISTLKKKSTDGEGILEHSPKILSSEKKATTTTTNHTVQFPSHIT